MAAALPQLATLHSRLRAEPIFNSEFDLLLACCSRSDEKIGNAIEQATMQSVNWDSLAQMAGHHGVLPQAFQRLTSHGSAVPRSAFENLKRLHQINSRKTLWLANELLRIAAEFDKHGIHFLAYKGPTLGQLLYNDVTARQFGDLDLLVHPADVSRAVSLVRELGYHSELSFTAEEEQAYLSMGYERSFDSDFGRNLLEIKWRILPRFYVIDFNIEKIFLRATSIKIGEREIPTLSPEDLLLVLSVHAAKHGWEKLSWLSDIAALAQSVSLDWSAIQQQAQKLGVERILAIHLVLANQLLKTPLPKPLVSYIEKDLVVYLFAKNILRRIVACQNCDAASKSYFRGFAALRENKFDRAKFWWRLITTPNVSEWKTAKLGNPRSRLYLGIRFYRLAAKLIRN
jgi:hypothetical protein